MVQYVKNKWLYVLALEKAKISSLFKIILFYADKSDGSNGSNVSKKIEVGEHLWTHDLNCLSTKILKTIENIYIFKDSEGKDKINILIKKALKCNALLERYLSIHSYIVIVTLHASQASFNFVADRYVGIKIPSEVKCSLKQKFDEILSTASMYEEETLRMNKLNKDPSSGNFL